MIYICDIDGTIADIGHRLHFIQKQPADWDAFFKACPADKPIPEVIEVIRGLAISSAGHEIHMMTGRSEVVRYETGVWLNQNFIPYRSLMMRIERDHREDNIVKSELLDEFLETHSMEEIGGAFEDRQQVVDMYRARGLRVFQVAPGNF